MVFWIDYVMHKRTWRQTETELKPASKEKGTPIQINDHAKAASIHKHQANQIEAVMFRSINNLAATQTRTMSNNFSKAFHS